MLMPSIVPEGLKQIKVFKDCYKDVMGPHGKGSKIFPTLGTIKPIFHQRLHSRWVADEIDTKMKSTWPMRCQRKIAQREAYSTCSCWGSRWAL